MDNPRFVDDENILLLPEEDRDNDYDDYNTPNTSIIDNIYRSLHHRNNIKLTVKTKSKTR